jgi:hypothetical protein
MARTIEYVALTLLALLFAYLLVAPAVSATSQSIINSADAIRHAGR